MTEVEAAVADGRADAAVHSAKDMPSAMPADLVLGAVPAAGRPPRRPGRLHAGRPARRRRWWPPGSARRRAQLAYLRPDLVFTDLRGNMARRVAVGEDGTRLGRRGGGGRHGAARAGRDRLSDVLDPVDVLPQAGQGAIAVQCRADDDATRALLARHRPRAEPPGPAAPSGPSWPRSAGAARVPVGAFAEPRRRRRRSALRVPGLVASGDGRTVIRLARAGRRPRGVWAPRWRGRCSRAAAAAIEGFDGVARARRRDRLPGRRRARATRGC